jgi:hypothetical protein
MPPVHRFALKAYPNDPVLTPRTVGLDLWPTPLDECESRPARIRGVASHKVIRIGS